MALNGGRVGRPVRSSFPPSRSDLPVEVALGGVSRNSSSFKRIHITQLFRGNLIEGRWSRGGRCTAGTREQRKLQPKPHITRRSEHLPTLSEKY